jgi:hypothetical protein
MIDPVPSYTLPCHPILMTRAQAIEYINKGGPPELRTQRKIEVHHILYSSGIQKLSLSTGG